MTTQFADDLYTRLAPLAGTDLGAASGADAANDYALQKYTSALGEMFAQVETYAREQNDVPGWTPLVSIEHTAGDDALRWLAQMAGVRFVYSTPTADMIAALTAHSGRRRGTVAYLVEQVQALLTGTKRVFVQERSSDAYTFSVQTLASETPDAAAVEQAVMNAKPAGLVVDYGSVTGFPYSASSSTYGGTTLTYGESAKVLP